MIRTATIRGTDVTAERVAAFLPSNYEITSTAIGVVTISGTDVAGWTLDGYVLPRLASGCLFGTEVEEWDDETIANEAWSRPPADLLAEMDECPEDCDRECERGAW